MLVRTGILTYSNKSSRRSTTLDKIVDKTFDQIHDEIFGKTVDKIGLKIFDKILDIIPDQIYYIIVDNNRDTIFDKIVDRSSISNSTPTSMRAPISLDMTLIRATSRSL